MKINKHLVLVASLTTLATLGTSQAYAGFGGLLGDLKKKGEEVINEVSSDSSSVANVMTASGTSLDLDTLVKGLKEALKVGSQRAIDSLSAEGGYLNNASVRVPLPDRVNKVASLLRQYGLAQQVDEFEASMNRAAEKAAPKAAEMIIGALQEMSIEDARKIYNGADDAATQYFEQHTRTQLTDLFTPLVEQSMDEVGVTRYYQALTEKAKSIPYASSIVGADLSEHVTGSALDGLFKTLAAEEKQIRENPAARTTELLKEVFK